ncbi:hypothetical protein NLI96_g7306 [Meripilus lineatus]|uniref:Uncharacterized protein n=1 Tax=Meripilus lineatus TaxID=2056292 RepID=A0AAD5V1M9_9APHY|nr:hypothetical protein NLI96_g7306 [Physisporinus lineatus]
MPSNLVIPREYADVLDWAAVVRNPDETEKMYRHIIVYNTPISSSPPDFSQVVVHIQGFVAKLNLHPLGDWNPSTGHGGAVSAKQYIALIDCNVPAPFEAQVKALNHLIGAKGIRLERKVFTRGSPKGAVKSALLPGDDLTGKARSMEPSWYVKDKLVVQEQQNGVVVQRNHAVIKAGDFVDVSLVLQVQKRPPATRPRVRVDLAMREIVLLQARSEIYKKYLKETRGEGSQVSGGEDAMSG